MKSKKILQQLEKNEGEFSMEEIANEDLVLCNMVIGTTKTFNKLCIILYPKDYKGKLYKTELTKESAKRYLKTFEILIEHLL